MHGLMKLTFGIAMLGGSLTAAQANTGPATEGHGHYNAHRPCHYYLNRDLPAPRRCYHFFSNALGPDVYERYGFVFRSHDAFLHYRDRGWFSDQDRFAAREERGRERAEAREESGGDMGPPEENDRYADRDRYESSGGASRGDMARESDSGGASRGDMARESDSGGASRGARVYEKTESGGAGRGDRIREGSSGGASGY